MLVSSKRGAFQGRLRHFPNPFEIELDGSWKDDCLSEVLLVTAGLATKEPLRRVDRVPEKCGKIKGSSRRDRIAFAWKPLWPA